MKKLYITASDSRSIVNLKLFSKNKKKTEKTKHKIYILYLPLISNFETLKKEYKTRVN